MMLSRLRLVSLAVISIVTLSGCADMMKTAAKDGTVKEGRDAKLSGAIASAAKDAQDSGMTRESLMLQEKLYRNDPNDQGNILQYARALRVAGRIDDAKLVIRTPAKSTRVQEPILTEAAMVLISAGEYDEALEFAQKAVEKNTKSVDAHHALALALSGLGKYEDAQLQFQETIQMWPQGRDQTAVINNLAMSLAAQGKIGDARTAMAMATGEALRSQTYQNNRALLETLKDRPAKEKLEAVIPLPSNSTVSLDAKPVKAEQAKLAAKAEEKPRASRKTKAASKAVSKTAPRAALEPAPQPVQAAPAKAKMAPIVE